jgi:hypothetical protein
MIARLCAASGHFAGISPRAASRRDKYVIKDRLKNQKFPCVFAKSPMGRGGREGMYYNSPKYTIENSLKNTRYL